MGRLYKQLKESGGICNSVPIADTAITTATVLVSFHVPGWHYSLVRVIFLLLSEQVN